MKVTAAFDVLSHWCYVAWPAFEAARSAIGSDSVELMLAPVQNGFPMGVSVALERWAYGRGSRAYGMTLRCDWYEDDRTSTLWANAAVAAAASLGADIAVTAHGMMAAAMRDGALLGRRAVAVETAARLAGLDARALDERIDAATTGRTLNEGNERLTSWRCAERPSWRIENESGDSVTMQGVWQAPPILAAIEALRSDERAYAAAGPPLG